MIRKFLLKLFSVENLIAEQAFKIDTLQMQCDLYEELAIIEAEQIRKVVTIGKLWEPNDIY